MPDDVGSHPLPEGSPDLSAFVKGALALGKRVYFTSRSQIIAHQRCPRFRWWSTVYGGRGITRKRLDVPLSTGGFTHTGLALLLAGHSPEDTIGTVRESYMEEVEKRGLQLEQGERQEQAATEQLALMEAFVWLTHYRVLPELRAEYEIVEIERDEWFVLYEDAGSVIIVETRADALLREKASSAFIGGIRAFNSLGNVIAGTEQVQQLSPDVTHPGDLYILSWKTAAVWDRRKAREAKIDMQGLSEAYPIELRLNEPVIGVKMVHLLKGKRQEDDWNPGTWLQRSPLIRAWLNVSGPVPQWAWAFSWKDPLEVNARTGRPVGHKLGKDWRLVFIPDHMPIREWMDMLNANAVQPDAGDCLAAQFISPLPEPRSDLQKRNWLQQTETQEIGIAQFIEELKMVPADSEDGEGDRMLNAYFPKYTHSCNYPKECQFWALCHGGETVEGEELTDPLSLFQVRTPHHPGEGLIEEGE